MKNEKWRMETQLKTNEPLAKPGESENVIKYLFGGEI